MDIYVISSGQPAETFVNFIRPKRPLQWKKYLLTVVLIFVTTLLDIFINPFVFPATLVTMYLLGIAAAVYLGYRQALIATVLSVMSFFFFFIPPSVDTTVESLRYLVILVGLLVAGVILTRFITGAMERADNASRHADQMMELYALSRDLSTTIAFEGIIATMMIHMKHTFQADAAIYLNDDDHLDLYQSTSGFPTTSIEALAAHEAYQSGQSSGAGTLSYMEANALYIPLRTAHKKVGVMGIAFAGRKALSLDQHRLLDAFANQATLVIEASRLAEQAHQVRLAREREKLQAALLDSISHDIRTPLVAITGALSSLRDEAALFDAQMRTELLGDAWSEAERLNSLVENLLEMSRLQSGELTLNCDWHSLDEIIGVARSQMRERLRDYRIITHIQPEVSLVYVDFSLLVQVLVNLLDNAAKYSTEAKVIEVCTMTQNASVVLQVADQGPGIPELELPHIFNKFYRASNVTNVNGTGLGLSICAGIIEAHTGSICAFNRPEGGAIFEIRLPTKSDEL
jgi:two-component system sensor histidine kinase KdpD